MKEFDLNIEKILDNWDISDGIREIIANALDEQIMTNTEEIRIFKKENIWHIRDFGRGITIENFTQNENNEKMENPKLIGKFGVGLKDALATFDRNGIEVKIESANGIFTLKQLPKDGFEDIITLHVIMEEQINKKFKGTDFQLINCKDIDVEKSKKLFLIFNNDNVIETTPYGQIITNNGNFANIYINGVKVAEENNFLFSYNITSLTSQIKRALNRERTNVGRTAYTDRVKSILLSCNNIEVLNLLTMNLNEFSSGKQKDELQWQDIIIHTIKELNSKGNTIFVTAEEYQYSTDFQKEIIRDSGKKVIFIPSKIKERLNIEDDYEGNDIQTVDAVIKSYNDSFEYKFIKYKELNYNEKRIYDYTYKIVDFLLVNKYRDRIFISETIQSNSYGQEIQGVYDSENDIIIIKRSELKNLQMYSGTLIHELIHATTGLGDISREFEIELTKIIRKNI